MTKKSRNTHSRAPVRAPSSFAVGYAAVLAEMTDRIATTRHRALATVNQELVALYWDIGRIIVRQQEQAAWGDAVVEQLSADLRAAFPDLKGLSLPNIWKMRQFYRSCYEIDHWRCSGSTAEKVGTAPRQLDAHGEKLSSVSRVSGSTAGTTTFLSTASGEIFSPDLELKG